MRRFVGFAVVGAALWSDPGHVALASVTVDEAANAISMSVQPLRTDDGITPVGMPFAGGPFPIQPDGSFTADFGEISMEGPANPISGSELATTLTLIGMPGGWCTGSAFVCGDVEGTASKPIALDLTGSTFTLQRVVPPSGYPAPVLNCAGAQP